MTITRETLELAAKAAGYEVKIAAQSTDGSPVFMVKAAGDMFFRVPWNPEHDDGDSARLRTSVELNVDYLSHGVLVKRYCNHFSSNKSVWACARYDDHVNKHAALRYATIMVAAEIGRRMG